MRARYSAIVALSALATTACSSEWRDAEYVDNVNRRLADGPNIVRESRDDCLVRGDRDACEAMEEAYEHGVGVRANVSESMFYASQPGVSSFAVVDWSKRYRDDASECLRTGHRAKCFEAGATDYVAKPVNTEQLLSALRSWLHR